MTRKYLKNRERILLHLSKFRGDINHFNAPYSITQDGIAETIGIGRNNIPREIKRLVDENLVISQKARVAGFKNRRTVYFLTNKGIMEAKRIKENVDSLYVKVVDFSGKVRTIMLKEVSKIYGIELITAAINLESNLTLDLVKLMRKNGRRVHYIEENFAVRRLYGRNKELQKMIQWISSDKRILVIGGLSGIGKTTLVLKFVKDHLKDRDVFFIRLDKYKDVIDVLHQFAEFFSKMGYPKLEKYMRTHGRFLDFEMNISNALLIIKETCSDEILIFDNVEDAQPKVKAFIQKFLDSMEKNCKIILVGIGADKLIRPTMLGKTSEIYLSELDDENALQMLRDEGVPDEVAFKIISKYGGVPIILELAKSGDRRTIRKFLFEGILNNLSKDERMAVEFASVFRREFKMNALLLNNVEYSVIYSLIKKNILKEMEYEVFTLHRMLRNFIYDRLPISKKREYHLIAARYFLDEGNILEAVYHYVRGEKYLRANMLLAENYEKYLFSHSGEIRQIALEILNSYADVTEDHEWLLYGIIGDTYKISGEWEKAIENYRRARELSFSKDFDFMATVSWKLAEIYGKQGNAERGLDILKEDLKYESHIIDRKILAWIYYIMGNLHLHYGNYNEAQDTFMKSLSIGEKLYDPEVVGYSYIGLGRIFHKSGDYEIALENFIKAKEIFDDVGSDSLGNLYATLSVGILYYELLDSKAEKYLKDAIRMAEKIGDRWSLGAAYLNYANWLMYRDNYSMASKYLSNAEGIAKKLNAREKLFHVYISWGFYYSGIQNVEKSKEYFDRAIELAADMKSEHLILVAGRYAMKNLKKFDIPDIEKYEKIAEGEIKVVSIAKL